MNIFQLLNIFGSLILQYKNLDNKDYFYLLTSSSSYGTKL